MAQNVTIGRIVRFVDTNHQEWPAIVTVVHSETLVDLQVFRQVDIFGAPSVAFNAAGDNYTWHWPERG